MAAHGSAGWTRWQQTKQTVRLGWHAGCRVWGEGRWCVCVCVWCVWVGRGGGGRRRRLTKGTTAVRCGQRTRRHGFQNVVHLSLDCVRVGSSRWQAWEADKGEALGVTKGIQHNGCSGDGGFAHQQRGVTNRQWVRCCREQLPRRKEGRHAGSHFSEQARALRRQPALHPNTGQPGRGCDPRTCTAPSLAARPLAFRSAAVAAAGPAPDSSSQRGDSGSPAMPAGAAGRGAIEPWQSLAAEYAQRQRAAKPACQSASSCTCGAVARPGPCQGLRSKHSKRSRRSRRGSHNSKRPCAGRPQQAVVVPTCCKQRGGDGCQAIHPTPAPHLLHKGVGGRVAAGMRCRLCAI